MAEGDGVIYNYFKGRLLKGEIDLAGDSSGGGDTLKVALVTGHTPDKDAHNDWSDVSANECSGTGYTAGGKALTATLVTVDDANDRGALDAADVTWTSLDLTAGQPNYAILYDDTHASDALIAYFVISTPTNGGDWSLQWHANGILLLT